MNLNIDDCKKEYKVLRLKFGADETKIRSVHRKLALKHHPDRNTDNPDSATEKMQEINNAFDILREKKCWEVDYTFYSYMQNPYHNTGNYYQYTDEYGYYDDDSADYDQHSYAKDYSTQQEDLDSMSIFELADKGKNEKLKERLEQGESPNTDDQSQESPLSAAMFNSKKESNKEGVKILLEYGAHFNSFDFKSPDWDREDITYDQRVRPFRLRDKVIEDWNTEDSVIVSDAFIKILNDTSETEGFLNQMAKESKNIALKRALEANFSHTVGWPKHSILAAALRNDNKEGVKILLTHNATFEPADFKTTFGYEEEEVNILKNKTLEYLKQENSTMTKSIASLSYDALMWVKDSFLLEIGLKAGASPNISPTTDDCCKNSFLAKAIYMEREEHVKLLAAFGGHFEHYDFQQTAGEDSWNGRALIKLVLEDWSKNQNSILPPKVVFNNFNNDEFKALFSEPLQKAMPAETNESSHLSEALEMAGVLSEQT